MKPDLQQMLLRQLREPVWGTESSERLLMGRAADEIESLTAERDRLKSALLNLRNTADAVSWEVNASSMDAAIRVADDVLAECNEGA